MGNELTCEQVIALFDFYSENRLNRRLMNLIDEHLIKCKKCREFYMQSKKIADYLLKLMNESRVQSSMTVPANFMESLSPYVDNELSEKENYRIKKITITNPIARKDLESIYELKRIMHNSFDKTINDIKFDYSKDIIKHLIDPDFTDNNSFSRIIVLFTSIILIMVVSLVVILYL